MTDHFRAELGRHVLTLTFGTPDSLNVMNESSFGERADHLCKHSKTRIRAVQLCAQGDDFCAGGDLRESQAGPLPEGYARSAFAHPHRTRVVTSPRDRRVSYRCACTRMPGWTEW
jgi:enoyl-CoA hydratase/carnithine racemase